MQYVGVQASEKVSYNVAAIASGPSGHGSIPRPDNAVMHLAAAIAEIGNLEMPVQPMTITRRYFEQLSQVEDDETAKWMRALQTRSVRARRRSVFRTEPVWNSMLRDSIAPQNCAQGCAPTWCPSEARANLNIRLLPGNSIDG